MLRAILFLVAIAWGLAVASGFGLLLDYANTPGSDGICAPEWPADTALVLDESRPTLILALHPHCPCSRASVSELAEIMARAPDQASAQLLFCKPSRFPAGWEQTDLWDDAAAIPGLQLHCDEEGVEAKRFGALTSGQAILFNRHGRVLFRGGITSARGHAGDNAGREAILAILTTGSDLRTSTPVFGCPLFDSELMSSQER
jgi:hypothetical protein